MLMSARRAVLKILPSVCLAIPAAELCDSSKIATALARTAAMLLFPKAPEPQCLAGLIKRSLKHGMPIGTRNIDDVSPHMGQVI